jgi:hypothetical protein
MRDPGRKFEKIISVAGQDYTFAFMRKAKNGLIGRVRRERFAQQRHLVTELFEQITQVLGHISPFCIRPMTS